MKFQALFRIYESHKYDGSCTLAALHDLLNENGQPIGVGHSLWASSLVDQDHEIFLWTDNPGVYGRPDETHKVFGQELTYEDFQSTEYGKYENGETNYEVQYVKVPFEAVLMPQDGKPAEWQLINQPAPSMKYLFIISAGWSEPVIINAKDLSQAYQKLHAHIKAQPYGATWTDDWRKLETQAEDVGHDVERYGPFESITEIN